MTAGGGGGGGGDDKKSTLRWLDAVRYAVAAAVTLLIMAVIVNAIKVVLRPESLQLSVAGGSVSTARLEVPPPEEVLSIEVSFRAHNPSGRARMYYVNIRAYLFDKNMPSASSNPVYDCVVTFKPTDMAVSQQEAVDSFVSMKPKKAQVQEPYFDMLYNGSSLSDMTLRLDGDLVTEVTSEFNKTRRTSYYCEHLLVGRSRPGDDDKASSKYRQDVICNERGA